MRGGIYIRYKHAMMFITYESVEKRRMDPASIIPWGIAAVFVIVYAGYIYGRRRSEGFHRFARRKGLSYAKKADAAVPALFDNLELIPDHTTKTVSNIIKGEVDGITVIICDYRTTEERDGSPARIHQTGQTIAILQGDQIDLPFFTMHPANFVSHMLPTFGKKSIDFTIHPEFSGAYVLKSDDENGVRKTFHDRAVSYFINHKGMSIEGRGNRLLYFRDGKFIKPAELNSFLSEGLAVFRLFE